MILIIITGHYLLLAMLFMQLRGLLATLPANAFENDAFAYDLELIVNFIRDGQIIIGPTVKVEYFAAVRAMYMMVVGDIRVEPLGAAENFDNIYNADFCKCHQRAIHGVEGNVGIFFFDDLINGVSRGMGVRIKEFPKNRDPLGRHFKSMRLTDLFELLDFVTPVF